MAVIVGDVPASDKRPPNPKLSAAEKAEVRACISKIKWSISAVAAAYNGFAQLKDTTRKNAEERLQKGIDLVVKHSPRLKWAFEYYDGCKDRDFYIDIVYKRHYAPQQTLIRLCDKLMQLKHMGTEDGAGDGVEWSIPFGACDMEAIDFDDDPNALWKAPRHA